MSRESFQLSTLYSLILLLSFSLHLSVKGTEEVLPSSSSSSTSTCYGFRASCPDSASLCFPSSKSSENHETGTINPPRQQQSVAFALPNGGGTVTCSSVEPAFADGAKLRFNGYGEATNPCKAPLVPDDWMKASNGVTTTSDVKDSELGRVDANGSPNGSPFMEVTPSVLNWGVSSLYVASVTTLTLINSHQERVMDVYEPYCTDPQFYPYDFGEIAIEPGENASVSFVFLPRNLGLSSAQIVLQTSFGGFVLQAVGVANESAYDIEPLVGIELRAGGGTLVKTLSIKNPFGESIRVEEVAVWMAAPESVRRSNHAVCQLGVSGISSGEARWFDMGNERYGLMGMDIRPVSNWAVPAMNGGTIVELRLRANSQMEVFGAICLRLRNVVTQRVITIVVPIEVHVHDEHDNPNHDAVTGLSGSVSASFDSHVACDGGGSISTLYLRNDGLDSLRIVNIFEDREGETMYEIRYLKNLILIPVSTTAVALISRKPMSNAIMSEIGGAEVKCDLVVETNHSSDAFLRIPCQEFARDHQIVTGGIPDLGSEFEMQPKEEMNEETEKIGQFKEVEATNLILTNWLSHGKASALSSSISIKQLIPFPPVQIGSYSAQPIPVKNPLPVPALVQLILTSEELVTDCKTSSEYDSSEHTIPNRSPEIGEKTTEMRFGFSVADPGLTETILRPFESASLGPIIFHPSSRCTWLTSALIRNNVSGIEWVSLTASGGSHSISLLDGSEPVQKLQLEFEIDPVKNISSSLSCDHRISKEIYAKNTGELPLEIKKIRVSGTDCKSDGFAITRNCLGFSLLPGESELIGVSYRPDFASGTVQRDLELVMAGGVFVIPMKVKVPVCMVGQCKKAAAFWRAGIVLLFVAVFFVVVLVFVRVIPPLSLTSGPGGGKCYYSLDDNACCGSQDEKRIFFHHSTKSSRSIAREQKKPDRPPPFMPNYSMPQSPPKHLETNIIPSNHPKKPASPSPSPSPSSSPSPSPSPSSSYSSLKPTNNPSSAPASPVATPQTNNTNNLTIRVVREKGKRRKRRAGSNNNSNLAAKLEASSSHSSNSTPSSPLSPTIDEANITRKVENEPSPEPSFYPSLVFSGPHVSQKDSNFVAKTAPIAPPARAKREESNNGVSSARQQQQQFTYDMWADHFSGRVMYDAEEGREDYSKSFFAIQPQASRGYGGNINMNNKSGCNGENITGGYGMN